MHVKRLQTKLMSALFLAFVPCGIQKEWFNILSEVCQEIATYNKAAAATGKL